MELPLYLTINGNAFLKLKVIMLLRYIEVDEDFLFFVGNTLSVE